MPMPENQFIAPILKQQSWKSQTRIVVVNKGFSSIHCTNAIYADFIDEIKIRPN